MFWPGAMHRFLPCHYALCARCGRPTNGAASRCSAPVSASNPVTITLIVVGALFFVLS